MRPLRMLSLAAASLLVVMAPACGSQKSPPAASRATKATASAAGPSPFPQGLDPKDFSRSTDIDNRWWPLKPGTQWTWEGQAFEDGERVERRVVFTLTDLTKMIGGVRTVVGYDRDFDDDELGESELIFLAQDNDGNVWHLGQYAEGYDHGELAGAKAWLAGFLKGAKPGILMKADPTKGSASYSEGFAPAPFFWADEAQRYKVGQRTCVRGHCYSDVLVIREFEKRVPGASQLKYYARGVGNIKVGYLGNDSEKETLELVKKVRLGKSALAKMRKEALTLEARASLYGQTPPAQRR